VKKIFDAFSQADSGTSREFGGTGLGLSISSQMIELMGGKIHLESQPNKGSTFSFILTLEEDKNITNEIIMSYDTMQIGLALPVKNIERDIDIFLEKYCNYLGQDFTIYYYDDIFNAENQITLPDVMIFDHHYARYEGELEKISALSCKKVLITNGLLKNRIDLDRHKFNSITHAPIMLHKLETFLQEVTGENKKYEDFVDKEIAHFINLKALVAEDNPINQKLIKLTLEKFGLDVTLVDNGQEAVNMRKENHYDLIFMDIQMPIMNGIEATEAILAYEKENNIKNHIPIIALTANALVGDREKYIEAGLDNYIAKPIELESIKDIVYSYFPSNLLKDAVQPIDTIEEKVTSFIKENDTNTIEMKKNEEKITSFTADILLYRRMKLTRNLYSVIFKNLGYSVEVVSSESEVMDKLESGYYRYVVYDMEPFINMQHLIVDIIKDANAIPIVFCKDNENTEMCCETLSDKPSIDEIKEKFKLVS